MLLQRIKYVKKLKPVKINLLFYKKMVVTWRVSDCGELVGKVNHSTECVTEFFNC